MPAMALSIQPIMRSHGARTYVAPRDKLGSVFDMSGSHRETALKGAILSLVGAVDEKKGTGHGGHGSSDYTL